MRRRSYSGPATGRSHEPERSDQPPGPTPDAQLRARLRSARSEGIGPAEAVDSRDPAASFARPRSAPRRRSLRAGLLGNFAFRGGREHDWTSQTLVRDASELTGFELLDEYQQLQLDLPA